MIRALLLAVLITPPAAAQWGQGINTAGGSGGVSNGSDFNGDDIVAKTLSSTGTAPSATLNGLVVSAGSSMTVTGGATVTGNLGIGTASPSKKLHVSSGTIMVDGGGDISVNGIVFTESSGKLSIGNATAAGYLTLKSGTGARLLLYNATPIHAGFGADVVNTNELGIYAHGSGGLGAIAFGQFGTGSDPTSGAVNFGAWNSTGLGIGTSSPSGKLHVSSGIVKVEGTGSALELGGGKLSQSYYSVAGSQDAVASVTGNMVVNSTATTGNPFITAFKSGGNMRFGVVTDGTIYSESTSELSVLLNGSSGIFKVYTAAGNGVVVANGSSGFLSLETASNVGVHDKTPDAAFEVKARAGDEYVVMVSSADDTTQLLAVRKSGQFDVLGGTLAVVSTGAYVTGVLGQTFLRSCATGVQTDASGVFSACVASDRSLKSSIASLRYDPKAIDSLRPVSYKWKKGTGRDAGEHIGFIAQEVNEVSPQSVVPAGVGLSGIDPNAVLALVVKELQTLRKRVAELEKK